MTYFLDFDQTLFDTDAFITYLASHPDLRLGRPYAAGELVPFVYADVPEFLRMAGNEAIIVTYGTQAIEERKIENALTGIPRLSVLYTDMQLKGPFLKDRYARYGSNPVFVDDSPGQLESVAHECPTISLFEMRRDGKVGDGRWPVISSLTELP